MGCMTHRRCALVLAFTVGLLSGCGPSGPDSAVEEARRVASAAEEKARQESAIAREIQRLKYLWTYSDAPVPNGRQVSALIGSSGEVDTGGAEPRAVRLVFRDHPAWGRSSYLVLWNGDFDCYGGCTVRVTTDNAKPKAMKALRPKTDEAIAMFITDWRTLWRMTNAAKQLTIEFAVKGGGTRTAVFEVGGVDASKMPGWSPQG
jgi:hypothetical protein